jgi:hypothetical protein
LNALERWEIISGLARLEVWAQHSYLIEMLAIQ